jgi:hypothetical protein
MGWSKWRETETVTTEVTTEKDGDTKKVTDRNGENTYNKQF